MRIVNVRWFFLLPIGAVTRTAFRDVARFFWGDYRTKEFTSTSISLHASPIRLYLRYATFTSRIAAHQRAGSLFHRPSIGGRGLRQLFMALAGVLGPANTDARGSKDLPGAARAGELREEL
jgi:hypothetical protein